MSACNLLNIFTGSVSQPAAWMQLYPCVDYGKAEETDDLPYMDFSQIHTKQLEMKNLCPHVCLFLTLKVIALSAVDLQGLWSLAGCPSQGGTYMSLSDFCSIPSHIPFVTTRDDYLPGACSLLTETRSELHLCQELLRQSLSTNQKARSLSQSFSLGSVRAFFLRR